MNGELFPFYHKTITVALSTLICKVSYLDAIVNLTFLLGMISTRLEIKLVINETFCQIAFNIMAHIEGAGEN